MKIEKTTQGYILHTADGDRKVLRDNVTHSLVGVLLNTPTVGQIIIRNLTTAEAEAYARLRRHEKAQAKAMKLAEAKAQAEAEAKAAKKAEKAEDKAARKAEEAERAELRHISSEIKKLEAEEAEASVIMPEEPANPAAAEKAALKKAKADLKAANEAELATQGTVAHEQAVADVEYHTAKVVAAKGKLAEVTVLNDGDPMEIGTVENGHCFCISPSTAKKNRAYYTDKPVLLTRWEKKMPGVVVCQNRGMLFSGSRPVKGDYAIPTLDDLNLIVVDEKSEKLRPVDTADVKIAWVGQGDRTVKEVGYDGAGQHWFVTEDGALAVKLWLKTAKYMYGLKGMIQPGLATDVGEKVLDHWGIERTITLGNTMLVNSSMIKGMKAYTSLEELKGHAREWGLNELLAQWQSGDHPVTGKRQMGTQPMATNLELTEEEITELFKPEALRIWAQKFEKVAWMQAANINTSRGRALAARPSLMEKDLIMDQIDQQAGNRARKLAQGKFTAEGEYLKLFPDKLAYSLMYVHGLSRNEAAKQAAATGLHGELRVNPSFAGRYYYTEDAGVKQIAYRKTTYVDSKGRYVEAALVRYPHGAPSETIIAKLYLDETVPADVIVFPLPVANDDGTIPARDLLCLRLQGADFDGDSVTAFTEYIWLEAQRRNEGKPYMVIPVNTESTEKDGTLVTDEDFELFCEMKSASLSNQVGLIATHLKYLVSQMADTLRLNDEDTEVVIKSIIDAAIAMGNDIDEFKHGKALLKMALYQLVLWDGNVVFLKSPYFNRYAMKYRSQEDFDKAVFNKDGSEKTPGTGTLDRCAVVAERLMEKAGIPFQPEVAKASDGKDRWYYTVHPVKWQARDRVDLYLADKGEGQNYTSLPVELEEAYGVEPGTTFSAKSLFNLVHRDYSALCKKLEGFDEMKALTRAHRRYVLAQIAIIAWTKAMKKAKEGIDLTAEEAMKVFTTLMVQHPRNGRSTIEVMCEAGVFTRSDGTQYERTAYDAQRKFNYFLDLCGDGLFLLGQEKPNFPAVPLSVTAAIQPTEPDLEKAEEKIHREMELLDRLVDALHQGGVAAVTEAIDSSYIPPEISEEEREYAASMEDYGCFSADPDWA